MPLYITRNGNDVVTRIGKALLPFANTRDHDIVRVIEALEVRAAACR